MAARATISPGYRWRLGLMGLMFLGFGLWAAYDGFIAYPAINRMAEEVKQFKDANPDWLLKWPQEAEARGWPKEHEEVKQAKIPWSMYTQYIMMALGLPLGLWFAVAYVRAGGYWIASDEQGLTASWGQKVRFASITALNKQRWPGKGIAVVNYSESGAGAGRLVLDDWKYDRHATGQILEEVEAHLKDEQILGDKPERAKEKAATDAAPEARGEDQDGE